MIRASHHNTDTNTAKRHEKARHVGHFEDRRSVAKKHAVSTDAAAPMKSPKRNLTDRSLDLPVGLFPPPGTEEAAARAVKALDTALPQVKHASIQGRLAEIAGGYFYKKTGGERLSVKALVAALSETKAAAFELANVIAAHRDSLNLAGARGLQGGPRRIGPSKLEGLERELNDLIALCSWADDVQIQRGRRADSVPDAARLLARLYVDSTGTAWTKNLEKGTKPDGGWEYAFQGNIFVEAALLAFDPELTRTRAFTALKSLPLPIRNYDVF